MHEINVLILGSVFSSTLNELKSFLKFNPLSDIDDSKYDVILFHEDLLKDTKYHDIIEKSDTLKVCASKKKNPINNYDGILELPCTIKHINQIIENVIAKNKFSKNSAIEIKNYLLNKNEKKLSKENHQIILTEKEIHLLELLLKSNKPISKNDILKIVWNYSTDADTHTVETHIYRLRKKISDEFKDNNFIKNNKEGYYL
jgi:hypothetical protein